MTDIRIEYCTQCNWLLRANWLAGEVLSSFSTDLTSVTLVPGIGGVFTISVDDEIIWDRRKDGGFPDAAELKRRVRDVAWPDRALGHADRGRPSESDAASSADDA